MTHYLYVAGPMRHIKDFNFPAFRRATKILRARGFHVTSPHESDEAAGYNWEGCTGYEDLSLYGFNLEERLIEDILAVSEVDAVVVLEGWKHSAGARAEASFAWAVGTKVFAFEEGNRINGFTNSLTELTKGIIIPAEYPATVEEWTG